MNLIIFFWFVLHFQLLLKGNERLLYRIDPPIFFFCFFLIIDSLSWVRQREGALPSEYSYLVNLEGGIFVVVVR